MSLNAYTRVFLIAACLIVSSCSERAIVRQVPTDGSEGAPEAAPSEPDTSAIPGTTDGEPAIDTPVINEPVIEDPEKTEDPATSSPTTDPGEIIVIVEPPDFTGPVSGSETPTDPAESNPPEKDPEDTGTDEPDSPAGPQTGTTPTVIDDPESPLQSDPATPIDSENPTVAEPNLPAQGNPAIAEPSEVIGDPGMTVNCQQVLPCTWVSEDSQFSVQVTNADNIGRQGRLTIEYSITTLHDAQLSIVGTEPAVDDTGTSYEPTTLAIGDAFGGAIQSVLAGSQLLARVEFDADSNADSITEWSISLSDTGLVRQPRFSGIRIGSATDQITDCKGSLPCTWESPAGDASITLIAANGLGSTNRLSVNFTVQTMRNTAVAVDSGSTAVGTDGMQYAGRTHAIGTENSAEKVSANAIAGAPISATVFFSRTQGMSAALQQLSLIVYEDRPLPRWNPIFASVPVQ